MRQRTINWAGAMRDMRRERLKKSLTSSPVIVQVNGPLTEADIQRIREAQPNVNEMLVALRNLAREMRHMLRVNPDKDGGLYRRRLVEAEAVIAKVEGR
jgi:hypothetical protein